MKKLIIFILIVLCPFIMFAKDYETSDINIKLEISDKYIVLTNSNLKDNEDLKKLNIKEEYMEELMDKNNIYYDIIKNDISYEILVIVPDTKVQINNLANVSDIVLNDVKSELANKTGAKIANVYKTAYNYVVVDYFDSKTGYYIVNYYTVVNAKGYNIQLQKKSAISDEEKNELKEIVDSIEIKVLDEYKEETKDTKDKIDNYGKKKSNFDYMKIFYGALIGASAGIISYVIGIIIRKKKSS